MDNLRHGWNLLSFLPHNFRLQTLRQIYYTLALYGSNFGTTSKLRRNWFSIFQPRVLSSFLFHAIFFLPRANFAAV